MHMPLDEYLEHYAGQEQVQKAAASRRGRRSQAIGARGEGAAENALRAYGVCMVEQIATPFAITARQKGGWIKIERKKQVSGDRRGVMPDGSGRRVLAEVKTTDGDRVEWSRLEDHQVRALDENNRLGAVSLLVLVYLSVGTYVLRWPIDGFGPHKSITVQQAIDNQWDGKS